MYLAVERAKADNRKKLPVGFPWKCREMPDGAPCPEGMEVMTIEQIDQAKKELTAEYTAWEKDVHAPYCKKWKQKTFMADKVIKRINELNFKESESELSEQEVTEKNTCLAEYKAFEAELESISI